MASRTYSLDQKVRRILSALGIENVKVENLVVTKGSFTETLSGAISRPKLEELAYRINASSGEQR